MPGGKTTQRLKQSGSWEMRNALLFCVRGSDRQPSTCHVYAAEFACVCVCVWLHFPHVCGWVPACRWVHNLKAEEGPPASSRSPRVNAGCPSAFTGTSAACELMDMFLRLLWPWTSDLPLPALPPHNPPLFLYPPLRISDSPRTARSGGGWAGGRGGREPREEHGFDAAVDNSIWGRFLSGVKKKIYL